MVKKEKKWKGKKDQEGLSDSPAQSLVIKARFKKKLGVDHKLGERKAKSLMHWGFERRKDVTRKKEKRKREKEREKPSVLDMLMQEVGKRGVGGWKNKKKRKRKK